MATKRWWRRRGNLKSSCSHWPVAANRMQCLLQLGCLLHTLETSVFLLNKLVAGARLQSTASAAMQTVQQQERELQEQTVGNGLPFSKAKMGVFFQEQPRVDNQFLEDVTLQKYLKRVMPKQVSML